MAQCAASAAAKPLADRRQGRGGDRPGSARWALAGLSLAMLMPSLATSTANAVLPALAQAFTASFQAVQWIILSYLLSVTALIVAAGRLGDVVGRRRLLLGGIAIFTVASLLCGLSPTLTLLIAARILQGLGAAIMMALAMAFVGDVVPKARAGSAMGLLGTMSAIGTTLGPSVGGFLIAGVGARAIFLVNVPLGALALMLAWRTLPADGRPDDRRHAGFDWAGTALLIVTLMAYALAMTVGRGRFGATNIALLLGALLAGTALLFVEARTASPLIRLKLFDNRVIGAGLAVNALVATVMMATLIVGPFYLGGALGLGPAMVGVVLSAGPLVAALTGVPAGRLVDRFGSDLVERTGLVALSAGASALAVFPASFGIGGYIVPIIVMTSGYGTFQAANSTAIMAAAGGEERGIVSGMLGLARNLGLITGASTMGALFAFGTAAADVVTAGPAAIAGGMHAVFAVAIILVVAALAISLRRRPRNRLDSANASQ